MGGVVSANCTLYRILYLFDLCILYLNRGQKSIAYVEKFKTDARMRKKTGLSVFWITRSFIMLQFIYLLAENQYSILVSL